MGRSYGKYLQSFVYKSTVCNISSAITSVKMQLPLDQSSADLKSYCSSPLIISLQFSRHYISGLECSRDIGVNEF